MTTVPPWLPDTAPHPAAYPTSADLAAFRGSTRLHHMDYPATRWERTYGVVREAGQRDFASDPARHSEARREAAAMRSRAYQRRWPGGAYMDRADHWPTPAR